MPRTRKAAPAEQSTRAPRPAKKSGDPPPGDKFLKEQRAELLAERASYVAQAESWLQAAEMLAEYMEPGDIQFD